MSDNVQVPPDYSDYWDDVEKLQVDCAIRGSKLLCELARIPDACEDQFREEVGRVLSEAYMGDWLILGRDVPPEIVATFEKFEKAVREAYSIFLSLPEYWCWILFFEPRPGEAPSDPLSIIQRADPDPIFRRMIRRCAEHTGRRPTVTAKRGRGRRTGDSTKDTYPFKNFVWKLARTVGRHGGHLTLYAKEQRGTWVDALNGLRLLFPEGFIPSALPLSMIEEVQTKANKFSLKSKKSPG